MGNKKFFLYILLCMYFGQTLPVFIQATVLKHLERNKAALLLGDAHYFHISKVSKALGFTEEAISDLEKLQHDQFNLISELVEKLINNKKNKTTVITETNLSTVGYLFEQEAGFTVAEKDTEAILFLSRLLMRNLMKNGSTQEEKQACFNAQVAAKSTKEYLAQCSGILVNDACAWLLGDTMRNKDDFHLSHSILMHREPLVRLLKDSNLALSLNKNELAFFEQMKPYTIGFVKQYVSDIQGLLMRCGMSDGYGQKIIDAIEHAVAKSNLSDDAHMALLYTDMTERNASQEVYNLNNLIICLVSQKCDLELACCARAVTDAKDECDQLVVVAGAMHTKCLKDELLKDGYQITQQVGTEIDDNQLASGQFYQDLPKQVALFNQNIRPLFQAVIEEEQPAS